MKTLRLRGPGELSRLDPACCHPATASSQAIRLFTRQLFGYRPERDLRSWQAIGPVPDLALEIPSIYNAGLGATGTSQVVHLRTDVWWDTTPPRRLVAADVIRGLKRMGNPVLRSPLLAYFLGTIRGFDEFCSGYRAAVRAADPGPEELAGYQNSHDIPGVFALDEHCLVFELVRPALDFAGILALPCAAPAPVEYDALVPGSPEFPSAIISIGPYRPVEVSPTRLSFERNPVWQAEPDPLRRQHVDRIEITRGPAARDDVDTGVADLPWGLRAAAPDDDPAYSLDPYIVVNTVSPAAGYALGQATVRRAITHAIDKAAVAAVARTAGAARGTCPADAIIPVGNDGYGGARSPYRTDVATARTLLTESGHPDGLALSAVCPRLSPYPEIFRSVAADLAQVGISVEISELDLEDCLTLLEDPENARGGAWDLACVSWPPSWLYLNRRVFLQPLVQSHGWRGTANYGQFGDPHVDKLIESALDAADPRHAALLWRAVEQQALDACAIVPLLFQPPVEVPWHSRRVRDAVPLPALGYAVDLTGVRLAGTGGEPTVTAPEQFGGHR